MIVGVIADTHVPDRSARLDPRALEIFGQAGVAAILHAGDICVPKVLDELAQVAPVQAVGGNRDWVRMRGLPRSLLLEFEGVPVLLDHGHGGVATYFKDKAYDTLTGFDEKRYWQRLLDTYASARVIVFGHTHIPHNRWVGGRLLFNPGSASHHHYPGNRASVGLLKFEGGQVQGETVEL